MTCAYDSILKDRACRSLGMMLDYAAYSLRTAPDSMMKLFTASGAAPRFERGDIRLICGMSGIELAYHVFDISGLPYERTAPRHTASLSAEYWCGHTLALIQHQSCESFDDILGSFSISGFISSYTKARTEFLAALPLDISEPERAASLRRFGADYAEQAAANPATGTDPLARTANLKKMRIKNGLSQSQLAKASGIPVRTIQQYEQQQKDLSKARAESLLALARALNCDPSLLI